MEQGDFTSLAKHYIHRPGYSDLILKTLASYIRTMTGSKLKVADVGAGTGKLSEHLLKLDIDLITVEPNEAMRTEGQLIFPTIKWLSGSAEETGLQTSSVDWILMGSSFHWPDQKKALNEFYRVLKPRGFFTALWNPRDLEKSQLQQDIDQMISKKISQLKRVSSGHKKYTSHLEKVLTEDHLFSKLIFMEAPHKIDMSKERYLGVWKSVNDIQSQAGTALFQEIMEIIEDMIKTRESIPMFYKTRAWTVQSNKQ